VAFLLAARGDGFAANPLAPGTYGEFKSELDRLMVRMDVAARDSCCAGVFLQKAPENISRGLTVAAMTSNQRPLPIPEWRGARVLL
jgi:hypothetical protein